MSIDGCNINALLSVVFIISFHLVHSDITLLLSNLYCPRVLRITCGCSIPDFPLCSEPYFQIPYVYQWPTFFSTVFLLTYSHKFLTQVLWCQTVSTHIFFSSCLKSCFLCSCATSTWSLKQLQPLELPGSWWTSISYLPDVLHACFQDISLEHYI